WSQRSRPCLLRDRRLFQTRGPQDTFPLPNSGLGARSSFGQKTEPVLRRSRQYIRLDSLNPDLRCAKHRYWVTTYRFRPLHFHSPSEGSFFRERTSSRKILLPTSWRQRIS